MNSAFEESAMFENMMNLVFKDEYEVYVFDTAPTANARAPSRNVEGLLPLGGEDTEEPKGGKIAEEIFSFSKKKKTLSMDCGFQGQDGPCQVS